MNYAEREVWTQVYAAVVGGFVGGPHGAHYSNPTARPHSAGESYIDPVSHAARVYADRAVMDYRRAEKETTR